MKRKVDRTIQKQITPAQYQALQDAYDFFNERLFGGTLPQVLVTLQRHAKMAGYFHARRFMARTKDGTAHELALNPDGFMGRSDALILSVLAHEQAHVWQETHGKPPRRAYHDRQWAAKMIEVGLQPSSTGAPGGKETGQRMSHYILPGGAFAKAYAELKKRGFKLGWESMPLTKEAKAKKASKTKFTCPACAQNAWGKPDTKLICGVCFDVDDEIVELIDMNAAPTKAKASADASTATLN